MSNGRWVARGWWARGWWARWWWARWWWARWCWLGVGVLLSMGLAAPAATAAVAEPAAPVVAAAPRPGFVLPLAGPAVVLTAFQPPEHRYGPGHRGVDLAAVAGQQVRAAGPGAVVYAGNLAGRGVVSVEHAGGLRTTYEPVAAQVTAGSAVQGGQPIGVLEPGHPSCAPASCLHWGARLPDGSYLDPMSLLNGLRVRLLPWAGRE